MLSLSSKTKYLTLRNWRNPKMDITVYRVFLLLEKTSCMKDRGCMRQSMYNSWGNCSAGWNAIYTDSYINVYFMILFLLTCLGRTVWRPCYSVTGVSSWSLAACWGPGRGWPGPPSHSRGTRPGSGCTRSRWAPCTHFPPRSCCRLCWEMASVHAPQPLPRWLQNF